VLCAAVGNNQDLLAYGFFVVAEAPYVVVCRFPYVCNAIFSMLLAMWPKRRSSGGSNRTQISWPDLFDFVLNLLVVFSALLTLSGNLDCQESSNPLARPNHLN
jgi:hypothetical protein